MLTSFLPVSGASVAVVTQWIGGFPDPGYTPLRDEVGAALTSGSFPVVGDGAVYQIGYFGGIAAGVDPTTVPGIFDTFVAISGAGSLNPILNTTIGDSDFGGAPVDGIVALTTTFDSAVHAGIPASARLAVRFYNGTTMANSDHYNTVTSTEGSWIFTLPVTFPPPQGPNLFIDGGVANGTLLWEGGTPLETSLPMSGTSTITWQDTGTDWSQASSWDNSGGGSAPPSASDIANFGADATITNQPDLNGTNQSVMQIDIDNSGDDYVFRDSGNGSLTIGTGGVNVVGGLATFGVNGAEINLVLGGDQTWDIGVGASLHYAELGNTFDFGNNTLTKTGAGTLILNENNYTNIGAATDVVVEAGTLQLEADPGTTNFAVELRTATLSVLGTTLAIERSAGHDGVLEVNATLNGTISGAGNLTIQKAGSGTATIASTISGTGNVTIDDANDTIRFTGNNTYSGTTTVTNGTLLIDGSQGSASGAVTVSTSATLGGSGTVGGATTMSLGSQLAAGGVGTTGTLSFVNGLDSSFSTWLIDVASSSDHDVVDVTGNLDISGATLTVNNPGAHGGPLVIANYSGTLTGTFDFDNLPAGWSIDYNYQGLNQIALIPEPGTIVPLVAILSPWIMRRRRRSRDRREA